jgi:hydrogenase-4 component F
VTDLAPPLAICVVAAPVAGALAIAAARSPRAADRLNVVSAAVTAAIGLLLAVIALEAAPGVAAHGSWYVVDAGSGVFLALVSVIGFATAMTSPSYLRHSGRSWFSARGSRAFYYVALHLFWAALIAVPLVDNLALAWLLVEATTAASALLVAFSGKRNALEAGWKYVVLTTLGLSVALLGIVVLFVAIGGDSGLGRLDWQTLASHAHSLPAQPTLVGFLLLMVGLATKIGWAPVHNWLPDAHSEAPPPVSAMLSAALLPTVLLVAWRAKTALEPAVGTNTVQAVFVTFGLASLLVAVPFLWRSLPWKRLLAYSSLEHMGILALGIAFDTPLAIAGVVLHVAGHGVAKSLGFYVAAPLLRRDPSRAHLPARGVASSDPATAGAMAVSLTALAGLPPSPLFVSELMILLGGIGAGLLAVSSIAAVLLALGFLGLAHALLDGLLGEAARATRPPSRTAGRVGALACAAAAGLLALTALAYTLPHSGIVEALTGGGT